MLANQPLELSSAIDLSSALSISSVRMTRSALRGILKVPEMIGSKIKYIELALWSRMSAWPRKNQHAEKKPIFPIDVQYDVNCKGKLDMRLFQMNFEWRTFATSSPRGSTRPLERDGQQRFQASFSALVTCGRENPS
jgi:hypothetical protein